jgi:hypothetical protein
MLPHLLLIWTATCCCTAAADAFAKKKLRQVPRLNKKVQVRKLPVDITTQRHAVLCSLVWLAELFSSLYCHVLLDCTPHIVHAI